MTGVVLDRSAVIAFIADEPEAPRLAATLDRLTDRVIGAPTLVETGIVLRARSGARGDLALDAFVQRFNVSLGPACDANETLAFIRRVQCGAGGASRTSVMESAVIAALLSWLTCAPRSTSCSGKNGTTAFSVSTMSSDT